MASDDMEKKVRKAVRESRETGEVVNIPIEQKQKEKKEKLKSKKVNREELDGSNIKAILKDRDKKATSGNCGHFRIAEKEYDKLSEKYTYKFEWDEDFATYAMTVLDSPDGLTKEEMDSFCLNMLLAKEENKLHDGVSVKEMDQDATSKRRKYYKKYK